jgi:hypothetical protein
MKSEPPAKNAAASAKNADASAKSALTTER